LIQQRILQLPFEATDTEEQVNIRQALLRAIDRRRHRLKLFSLNRARMIYVEKPARFVERLSVYWELWRDGGRTGAPRKRTGDGHNPTEASHRESQTPNRPAVSRARA
jgi:hypothetical protein